MFLFITFLTGLSGCIGLNGYDGTWTVNYDHTEYQDCDEDIAEAASAYGYQSWTMTINVYDDEANVAWLEEATTLFGPVKGKDLKASGSSGSEEWREEWHLTLGRKKDKAKGTLEHTTSLTSEVDGHGGGSCTLRYAVNATRVGR